MTEQLYDFYLQSRGLSLCCEHLKCILQVKSGKWKYFQECKRLHMVPRVPHFLVEGEAVAEEKDGSGVLTLSVCKQNLLDQDTPLLLGLLCLSTDINADQYRASCHLFLFSL